MMYATLQEAWGVESFTTAPAPAAVRIAAVPGISYEGASPGAPYAPRQKSAARAAVRGLWRESGVRGVIEALPVEARAQMVEFFTTSSDTDVLQLLIVIFFAVVILDAVRVALAN